MLLCACAHGVKSEILLDTGDSASKAVVKRSVLSVFINQLCAKCVFVLWTSCLRAKKHYCTWPFVKNLYHGWMNTMTSLNEISWKLPPPKWRAGCPLVRNIQSLARSSRFVAVCCLCSFYIGCERTRGDAPTHECVDVGSQQSKITDPSHFSRNLTWKSTGMHWTFYT